MLALGEGRSVTSGDDNLLGQALRASHQMEPGDLVALVADAAEGVGGRSAVVLVADYEQRRLVPLPGSDADAPAAVDGTVAGRSFVAGELVSVPVEGGVRLWAPLVDSSERLGVVGLVVDRSDDRVRAAIMDLAALAAQVLQTKRAYTDVYEQAMRQRGMTLASELLWSVLPPLTFSTPAARGVGDPGAGLCHRR